MRDSAWLGIDVGDARIGVAYAPRGADLAVPVETLAAHPRQKALKKIAAIAKEKAASQVIVGLPKHLSGHEGSSAAQARKFAGRLAQMIPGVRVALMDERRTTVQAKGLLHEAGMNERRQRSVVDQVAAAVILEHALERASAGGPVGETVLGVTPDQGASHE